MDIPKEYINHKPDNEKTSDAWWTLHADLQYSSIFPLVDNIDSNQSQMRQLHYKYAQLYNNVDMMGYTAVASFGPTALPNKNRGGITGKRPTYNVVKSVIDTITAKVAKSKPKPQFLTSEGDYNQQRRAENLTKYIEGVFYDSNAYNEGQKAFVDSCVFGTGVMKVVPDYSEGKITVERVFSDEIYVDYYDGMYGTPRQIHQVKYMPRDVLLDAFPDQKYAISSAASGLTEAGTSSTIADLVKVIESWHLPSGTGADDGCHTVSIESGTLFCEQYDKDYFPFVFMKYTDGLLGFNGTGITEQIVGIQIQINKLLRDIARAQDLIAVPRILVDNTGALPTSQISNGIGSVIKYTGTKPDFFTPQAMNPELYNHLKWYIQSAYEIAGISQLSAGSKKPSGLDSGVALREYNDIESERFAITGQRYETMFMELANIVIDMSRDLYNENKSLSVKVQGKDFIQSIKWKDVNLEDDKFIMKVYPTNILPSTPAGRLQTTQELLQAGFISQEDAISLLDFPDLKSTTNLLTANIRLIQKQLNSITETEEYDAPEPVMNLETALQVAQNFYLESKQNNMDDAKLGLILRYIDDVNRLIEQAMPPAPVQQPVSPQANPEALPTSDLIPNVPQV